jgi:hypothetical protein
MQRPAHGIEIHHYYSDLRVCTHISEPLKDLTKHCDKQKSLLGLTTTTTLFTCRVTQHWMAGGYESLNGTQKTSLNARRKKAPRQMFKVPQHPLPRRRTRFSKVKRSVNPWCTNLIRYGINCDMDRGRGKSISDKPKNIQRAYLFVSVQVGEIKRGVQIGGINASRDDGIFPLLHMLQ